MGSLLPFVKRQTPSNTLSIECETSDIIVQEITALEMVRSLKDNLSEAELEEIRLELEAEEVGDDVN